MFKERRFFIKHYKDCVDLCNVSSSDIIKIIKTRVYLQLLGIHIVLSNKRNVRKSVNVPI